MVYLGLAVVFACSLVATLLLPVGNFVTATAIAPGVAALFGALWQIFRDHEAYNRQIELQGRDHFFNLSITSHMADVTFDKHVAFSEEYLKRVHDGVGEMFRDGPSKDARKIATDLSVIHRKHAPWVTADMLEKLKPFEDALWKIGINAMIDDPKRIDEMYALFSEVLGIKWRDNKDKPESRADQILFHLQDVLGITELTRLRRAVVKNAMRSLDNI